MSLMVSISGLRGVVGTTLTPEVIVKYCSGFASYCNRKTIVIGRDGRITGQPIAAMVSSTLRAMGCNVINLGIVPTPTVQIAVEHYKASGGISITASHNPMMWNGLKFIASTGLFLDEDENKTFWNIVEKGKPEYAAWDKVGSERDDITFIDRHIDLACTLPYINEKAIRNRRFKVVLDCVNAAGGMIIPKLLRRLGCEVVELNCEVSGVFSHTPEPLPENLNQLSEAVVASKSDFGIAVDPDVDRLVLIDEHGNPYGEEYSIATVVKLVLEKEKSAGQTVVVNLSTTRAVEEIAKKFSATVIRTPVGEINVTKKMREVHALVGGEGSGGVIIPKVHFGRDAPLGIGIVLQQLAEFGGTLSEFKKTLPQYFITKAKIVLGNIDPDKALAMVAKKFANEGTVRTDDGVKIDFERSWVHLRKSNTEPLIRIIAEAPTKLEADALTARFLKELNG